MFIKKCRQSRRKLVSKWFKCRSRIRIKRWCKDISRKGNRVNWANITNELSNTRCSSRWRNCENRMNRIVIRKRWNVQSISEMKVLEFRVIKRSKVWPEEWVGNETCWVRSKVSRRDRNCETVESEEQSTW